MEEIVMVLSTFPSIEKARQIGTLLVEKQLAACVNLVPGVESIYRWQGKIETSAEVLAIFKTTAARQPELSEALGEANTNHILLSQGGLAEKLARLAKKLKAVRSDIK